MKQALDTRIATAAGKALERLGSMRKQVIANSMAEWETPWGAGAADKARRQEGQRSAVESSVRMSREFAA